MLEFASKPQEWATGRDMPICHIIFEVLTYPFVVIGEQASNNAQALLVHSTMYNSVQSFKDLGATLEEQMKADSEHHTSLRKVVHDTMTLKSWMSNTEWSREVCTATLSDADKLVNDGVSQVRAAFLGEIKRVR